MIRVFEEGIPEIERRRIRGGRLTASLRSWFLFNSITPTASVAIATAEHWYLNAAIANQITKRLSRLNSD